MLGVLQNNTAAKGVLGEENLEFDVLKYFVSA
jgi:hypothetical protein